MMLSYKKKSKQAVNYLRNHNNVVLYSLIEKNYVKNDLKRN